MVGFEPTDEVAPPSPVFKMCCLRRDHRLLVSCTGVWRLLRCLRHRPPAVTHGRLYEIRLPELDGGRRAPPIQSSAARVTSADPDQLSGVMSRTRSPGSSVMGCRNVGLLVICETLPAPMSVSRRVLAAPRLGRGASHPSPLLSAQPPGLADPFRHATSLSHPLTALFSCSSCQTQGRRMSAQDDWTLRTRSTSGGTAVRGVEPGHT